MDELKISRKGKQWIATDRDGKYGTGVTKDLAVNNYYLKYKVGNVNNTKVDINYNDYIGKLQ